MRFGNITLKHGIFLAPMAGVTDRPFRVLCKEFGAEFMTTEMISAKGVFYKDRKTARLAVTEKEYSPCAVQLFGHDPEILAYAAKHLLDLDYPYCRSTVPPAAIDVNMGCPVHKIYSSGDGSALMRSPDLIEKIVSAIASAVSVPVTVKIRAGIDSDHKNAVECAKAAESGGASLVTVHARTKEEMYSDSFDWQIIGDVKDAVKIPVVGNGSVKNADDFLRMKRETGCDGVMIGRACQGNPFLFEELTAALEGRTYTPPDGDKLADTAKRHLELLALDRGEAIAVLEMRKHLAWYSYGLRGSPAFRERCNHAETIGALSDMIEWLRSAEKAEGIQ